MNKIVFTFPTNRKTPNLNFHLYEKSGHGAEKQTPVHTEVRFEHGRQSTLRVGRLKGIAAGTEVDLMMSNTAKDRFGFPTYRKIIDAEFIMIIPGDRQ